MNGPSRVQVTDQSEEGAGLSYTTEGHGLKTKSDDTTHESVCESIKKL